MVVKLVGTVNGDEVIFQRTQGDMWEVSVPASLNGTYVLDMMAYDEAGTATYWARYIITVDLAALRVTLRVCPYRTALVESYHANLRPTHYRAVLLDGGCG